MSEEIGWTICVLPGVEVFDAEGRHLETFTEPVEVRIGSATGTLERRENSLIVRSGNGHAYVVTQEVDPRDGVKRLWCTVAVNLRSVEKLGLTS